jgi:hypothetical protein
MDYAEFLRRKAMSDPMTGIDNPPELPKALFPFQHDIVTWALRRGRAALFAGTGLGKSLMALSWANAVHEHTNGNVLILTPLAVAAQMIREANKFNIPAKQCKTQSEVMPGITVTNYAKIEHFDLSQFKGIVLDESSILKAQDGKTRTKLITDCQIIPFRLAATATPAPNDFMELGNHAEFLGVMSFVEMLAMFFVHDGGETQKWRLKGHAEIEFWRWMCSWAVMLRKPSDLGYQNKGFDLPPLITHQHSVAVEYKPDLDTGFLFPIEAQTLQERIKARRSSVDERVTKAAEIVTTSRPWVTWCNLNSESEALAHAIKGAVEVRGSDSEERKENILDDFSKGNIQTLVTKPSICGFGMNWQHCADTAFVGLNDSFEQVFQAVRRFWRFGQTKPVNVHFIASEIEGAVVANLRRKEADAEKMADAMIAHMADLTAKTIRGSKREKADYTPQQSIQIPTWMAA